MASGSYSLCKPVLCPRPADTRPLEQIPANQNRPDPRAGEILPIASRLTAALLC